MVSKKKALTIEELIKKHGAVDGSQYEKFEDSLPVLSTGNMLVDLAMGPIDPVFGNGGLRARDSMEVCAKPGSGKNVLLHSMIRTTQERFPPKGTKSWENKNIVVAFTEPPDIKRMRREGIDVDRLILLGCYGGETLDAKKTEASYVLEAILDFASKEEIVFAGLDSVALLSSDAMNDKELDEAQPVAAMAKMFNTFIKRFKTATVQAPLVYTNHYRAPINTGFSFVPPSILEIDTFGGKTKDFLSHIRILASASPLWRERGADKIMHSESGNKIMDGLKLTYTLFRNRYSNIDNYRVCRSDYNFHTCRFNNEESLIKVANHFTKVEGGEVKSILNPGVVQKGAWFHINGEKIQSMANTIEYLKENPEVYKQIEAQLFPRASEYFSDISDFDLNEVMTGGSVLD